MNRRTEIFRQIKQEGREALRHPLTTFAWAIAAAISLGLCYGAWMTLAQMAGGAVWAGGK